MHKINSVFKISAAKLPVFQQVYYILDPTNTSF